MSKEAKPGPAAGAREDEAPSPFLLLLGGLGAQVQIALGLIPDPTSGEAAVDLDSARQGIDMLGALELRTRGNLERREADFLTRLLAQLRMAYVERTKAAGSEGAGPEAGG